jgi:hypothetical protein
VENRTVGPDNRDTEHGLVAALHATGPLDELADPLQTFGQFVGSWWIDWYGSAAADEPDAVGELHFGWVLGGRAI